MIFINAECMTLPLFYIVDSPKPPVIQGYDSGTPLKVGDIQRFNCVSVGGNPPAMLRWFKGDREVSHFIIFMFKHFSYGFIYTS